MIYNIQRWSAKRWDENFNLNNDLNDLGIRPNIACDQSLNLHSIIITFGVYLPVDTVITW